MIILDTNVLSEAFRPAPAKLVMEWLDGQERWAVFTTTITLAEILYGLEALPSGKRKARLTAAIERVFVDEFPDRILPFDEGAARRFPKIVLERRTAGRPISQPDAMIAAIAGSRHATLATRNTADFDGCGIPLINPWRP